MEVAGLQVAAVARLCVRLREQAQTRAPGRILAELATVGAPIFAIQAASSPTLVNGWGPKAQIFVCLLPALAPAALLVYLSRTGVSESVAVGPEGGPVP